MFSFQLAKRLNSQNRKGSEFINELININLYMIIGNYNLNNWVSTPRKWKFWHYFSSIHDYWTPITWNSLVHNSWGEMERCEKRVFKLLKMRKKKISWNIKTKCITDFILKLGLRVWSIIFLITGWAHKSQTFTLISIKIMRILKYLVHT